MNRAFVFILCTALVFLGSCKKQNDNVFLSSEGTQGFDGYSYTDTFRLLTSTVREDSLKTDSLSHNLIGSINDPVFGTYGSASFFQFKLPQLNKVISGEKLDSVVLFLQFTSSTAYYGDLNSDVSFHVYELTEPLGSSFTHSVQSCSYNPVPAGTFYGRLRLTDSMNVRELGKTVKGAPGISIRLKGRLANKLFAAGSSALGSQDAFLQYFNGLAIVPAKTPASGQGVIAAINMRGTYSKIRIYYNDTLQSDFGVIDNARRFSRYDYTSQSSEIRKQKAAPAGSDFDTTFVMALGGAKTRILIPHLLGLARNNGKKISVGKAEIIVRPLAGSYSNPFTLPVRMLLLQPNPDNGLNAGIIDLAEPFYGGSYNAVANEYRFNVTRHVQGLFSDWQLKGTDNNRGFYLLLPSDFPIAPSRMVLDARKGIKNAGIEFKLIYTEL